MQANPVQPKSFNTSEPILNIASGVIDPATDESAYSSEPTHFHGHFSSCMEMYANAQTVADYLDAHQGWFRRCAHPMKADSLGDTGYALTIGRFGSFGYEVEPKIGLNLLPQQEGVYRIETIAIPDYEPMGYDVDFKAALQLVEAQANGAVLTRVEWELNLEVKVFFPRFINALPKSLVETTGDRLLNQIVRQVSRCLTHKVQTDFHSTQGIAFPQKVQKKFPWSRSVESESGAE